jgi:CoA:oxalate CoA-transferase
MMPCKDGHLCVHAPEDYQWDALVKLMGSPYWATDEKYKTPLGRMTHWPEIIPLIKNWMSSRTKEEVYHPAQQLGCTVTPVTKTADIVNSKQSKARNFFSAISHAEAGRFKYPTSPLIFSETPVKIERPAPMLGEHNEEIYIRRLGYTKEEVVQMAKAGVI